MTSPADPPNRGTSSGSPADDLFALGRPAGPGAPGTPGAPGAPGASGAPGAPWPDAGTGAAGAGGGSLALGDLDDPDGRHTPTGAGPDGPGGSGGSGGSGEPGDWENWDEAPAKKRKVLRRVLLATLAFVLLVTAGVAGLLLERESAYNSNIKRLPSALPTGKRPAAGVVGSENWLLVGSDTRAEGATTGEGGDIWKPGQQRSDTLMLMHLPADRKNAYVISFPRDSWVPVAGYGTQKINAAFSYGGPALLTETVEDLTGVRIDHFAAIDFNGFKSMTDALGGVEVTIDKAVHDPARGVSWPAGVNKLDGEKALLFVRQRYNLPNGDFDRIKRQQAFLRALASKAADSGTITNPLKLNRFLEAFTKSISMDDTIDAGKLRSLVVSLRGLRVGNVSFLTVPNKGSASRGKQSVVLLDAVGSKRLFEAIRKDEVAEYVSKVGGTNQVGKVS